MADSAVTLPPTGAGSATPVFSTRTNASLEHMEVVTIGIDGSDSVVGSDAVNGLDVDVTRVTGTVAVDQLNTAELDYDTGAGVVLQTVLGLALPGAGGPIAGGTAANPVRTDPTGTTAQPVSDGAGSLTVDSPQLPAALVGGRLDVDIGAQTVGALDAEGNVAHDAVDAGNPLGLGARAIAFGANPVAVAAADRSVLYANRAGVLFTLGGHPATTALELAFTVAQTDVAIVTVAGGLKIVVTALAFLVDEATTVGVGFRVGFGAVSTPTTTGVVLSHPGLIPGGGIVRGDGSGILGVGADGEDLRLTAEVPTTGSGRLLVSYFTIES